MTVRCIPALRAPLRLAAGALLFLAVSLAGGAALAQGESEVFAVQRVPVDVTAGSAAAAREQGIAQAQRDAFTRLFDRLTLDQDGRSPPALGPAEIEQLVDSFSVEQERTSAVRYVADITVRFRPAAIRQLMLSNGIRYAEVRSKPVLILPVDQTTGTPILWQTETPWRQAWEQITPPDGLLPVVVPYGELQDVTDISAEQALSGDQAALKRIADRYDAGAVAVAHLGLDGELTVPVYPDPTAPATLDPMAPTQTETLPEPEMLPAEAVDPALDETARPRGLMAVVTVHRFEGVPEVQVVEVPPPAALPSPEPLPGAEQPPADPTPIPEPLQGADGAALPTETPPPGVVELMPTAVAGVVDSLEDGWVRANLLETGQENVLSVTVPLVGLNDWMETRTRIAQVPTVTRSRVLALARDRAELDLYFLGDAERLRTALAQRDLILSEPMPTLPGTPGQADGVGGWRLQWRGAAPAAPVPAAVEPAGLPFGAQPSAGAPQGMPVTEQPSIMPGIPEDRLITPAEGAGGVGNR